MNNEKEIKVYLFSYIFQVFLELDDKIEGGSKNHIIREVLFL